MKAILRPTLWAAALSVLLLPFFYAMLREMLFNTVPRDDYAGFLLWLVGDPAGFFPESPYCYRLLSVALAWPLYHLLPDVGLTNLPAGIPLETLRATTALAMLAYLSCIGAAMAIYRLARSEGGLDRQGAVLAGALSWLLQWQAQVLGIDPLSIASIAIALCLIRNRPGFLLAMLVSVGINEKIGIVMVIWLGIRMVLTPEDRRSLGAAFLSACAAIALYAGLLKGLHYPGNEYQLSPSGYLATLTMNLAAYATPRGLLLNAVPIATLLALCLPGRHSGLFARADLLIIPAMMAVALVLTQYYQAGRIVMHAMPILIIPAAASLQRRLVSGRADLQMR